MQYSLLITVIFLVLLYVIYRAINYSRKTRKIFISIDNEKLEKIYSGYRCGNSFEEFKELWITVSRNLGCPHGKMIENCKISLLMDNYPFPEMFIDDIFMGLEKYSEISWDKEMLFGDFIASLICQKNIKLQS